MHVAGDKQTGSYMEYFMSVYNILVLL